MSRYTSPQFDHFVGVLIHRWEFALELQPEWGAIATDERLSYTEDWPVNNDIHQHLADYVANHALTEGQQAKWNRLGELVAQHTTDLEMMGYRVRIPEQTKKHEREVA